MSETYDEGTLAKVYEAFRDNGYGTTEAADVVTSMQNAGILFRERADDPSGEPTELFPGTQSALDRLTARSGGA